MKLIVAAIGGVCLSILILPLAFFAVFVPSGDPNIQSKYQADVQSVNSQLSWMDVYMFDYIKYQNDYSKVTDADIEADARLFISRSTVPNPQYDPKNPNKAPKMITRTVILSLQEVMSMEGYSSDDYQMALTAEEFLPPASGDTYTGTLPTVTVKELEYTDVPPELLYDYVHADGSIFSLSDIEIIEQAAQTYNVSPVLLLAITGQEQSFVPANEADATEIEQNPFNVEGPGQSGPGSWVTFHSSLAEAADIAADTLANKLATRPPVGMNPILWINDPQNPDGIYAQDVHWAYGVADIYASIESYISSHGS